MGLRFDRRSKVRLELDGESVELSVDELAALRDSLPTTSRSPRAVLADPVYRRLFAKGLLTPDELGNEVETHHWQTTLPGLALSPWLELGLTFTAGGAGASATEPSITMFLDPGLVEAAEQLGAEIRRGLARATRACAVRGVPFPRERGLALAQRIAFGWLNAHPRAAQWLEWSWTPGEGLRLAVRDLGRVGSAAPGYPSAVIGASLTGRPAARKEVTLPTTALPALARVMDALRAETWPGASESDVAAAAPVLGLVESVGGFIERHASPSLLPEAGAGDLALTVVPMGHAALIVEGGGRRLLVDPWLFPWRDELEVQPLVSSQLGRVDAIFFTHHHGDHLHPDSLLTLPHDVPVFVPGETGAPLEPRLAAFLGLVGFRDVRVLAHGESASLGEGLCVESLPFFGEGRNRLGFGANCYLISRSGRNVLVHADASPDSEGRSLLSGGVLRRLVARRGPIAVVFGTWWQERRFALELSPLALLYPSIPPGSWLDDAEMCDCPPEFLSELIRVTGASQLLLYAESGRESFLPRSRMSGYVPSVSFLWTPLDEVRKLVHLATGVAPTQTQPYMKVNVSEDGLAHIDWSAVGPSRRPGSPGDR